MSDLDRPVVGVTYSSAELSYFTLWRRMFHGVVAAGATPIAIDCAFASPQAASLVEHLDGIVIAGGGDVDAARYGGDPEDPLLQGVNSVRDEAEISVLAAARLHGRPVLAICRGAQLVNVALGGTLIRDLSRDRPTMLDHRRDVKVLAEVAHEVDVVAGSKLAKWLGTDQTIQVNSQHHQGIEQLAPGLIPGAWSPDGLLEAFEHPEEPLVGVQWHPEVLWPSHLHALSLLTGFVQTCAAVGLRSGR